MAPTSPVTTAARSGKALNKEKFNEQIDYLVESSKTLTALYSQAVREARKKKDTFVIDDEEWDLKRIRALTKSFNSQLRDVKRLYSAKTRVRDNNPNKIANLSYVSDAFVEFVKNTEFPPQIEAVRETALKVVTQGHVANTGIVMSLLNHFANTNLKGEHKRWRDDGTFRKYFSNTRYLLKGVDLTPKSKEAELSKNALDRLKDCKSEVYSKEYTARRDDKKVTISEKKESGDPKALTVLSNYFRIPHDLLNDKQRKKLAKSDTVEAAIELRNVLVEATKYYKEERKRASKN